MRRLIETIPIRYPACAGRHCDHEIQDDLEHGLRFSELVTELLHGDERCFEKWKLFAQAPDVNVDGPRRTGILVVPHIRQEPIAREHPAAVLEEILKQQELLCRQPHVVAVVRHGVAFDVEADRPAAQDPLLDDGCRRAAEVPRTRAISSFGLNGLTT